MRKHNCGKFHQNSISVCQLKSFQNFSYWFKIHQMDLFGRFLGPCFNIAKILTRGSALSNKNIVWKKIEGFKFLWKRDGPKFCTFPPTLTTPFLLKMTEIEKDKQWWEKFQPLGYQNMSKSRFYLLSPFNEKHNHFLQCLGYFCQGIWNNEKRKQYKQKQF